MIFYVVPKTVMISAGEASGELYGAMLSREIKNIWPDTVIFGIGGQKMEKEGVELIARISSVIGFIEAVRHLAEIRRTFKTASNTIFTRKPDLLVLIDYPDFNLALAKKAKSQGIPILYYVSPQVWAWRSGRIKKIAALVNRMAVLFPFEVALYEQSGLPCEFVGHPIAETINITRTREEIKKDLGLDPERPLIALLPGSRPAELQRHMPLIQDVARRVQKELPGHQIAVPLADGTKLPHSLDSYLTVYQNRTREVVAACDAAAVASGTATLETALLETPMVVFYRISPITYLFRFLVKVKFISLVNLLADREVVVELLQHEATPDRIYNELKRILSDTAYRAEMIAGMKGIRALMKGKTPSARVAHIAGEVAGWGLPASQS